MISPKTYFTVLTVLMFLAVISYANASPLPPLEGKFKIMQVGDSITSGPSGPYSQTHGLGGFRYVMERLMAADDDVSYEAVGPLASGAIWNWGSMKNIPMLYKAHAGYSGKDIQFIKENIAGWMKDYDPDVVLLMIGTNNFKENPPQGYMDRVKKLYQELVDNLLGVKPTCRIVFAEIPPFGEEFAGGDGDAIHANYVKPFNSLVVKATCDEYAARSEYGGDTQFFLADNHSALDTGVDVDLFDGVHPNGRGAAKVGIEYCERLLESLGRGIERVEIASFHDTGGADAFIDASNPDTAYGIDPSIGGKNLSHSLRVQGSETPEKRAKTYLRFSMTGKKDTYTKATLGLLYAGTSATGCKPAQNDSKIRAYALPDGNDEWQEDKITWNNAPLNDTSRNGLLEGAIELGTMLVPAGHTGGMPCTLTSKELLALVNRSGGQDEKITIVLVPDGDTSEQINFSQKEWLTHAFMPAFLVMEKERK